ncbi:filamentous hemagglutinin family protein [Variovorax sp. PAMC26660]|uniref:filamentous hemagglutinin family protein n=1 Tax=Variovorax sp. PAMC26660 TaxID=2762322 RepID=UPI00164D0A1E|nr:filamentous hemagglutinin family protein [Variovorax sp. PAMC26660]QNK67006.1 filamentous hemagglutinin family protein [Variovorax sp. PAMC26660]
MNSHISRTRSFAAQRTTDGSELHPAPLARAIAIALATLGTLATAQAGQAFSPAWMAAKGAAQADAMQTGRLPNGMPVSTLNGPTAQRQQAEAQLQRSLGNLNLAAQAIAAQQAAQAAARRAAQDDPSSVPDGLAEGGLRVDTNSLTAGWLNANVPVQSQANGRTNVAIQQTADRAILNWESFNVGRNTTVQFQQQSDWAVLNRVNDPQARPSQIQGQIKADGTVLIANRNGIVFNGTSQVDTRNLVAAAAKISDEQFKARGIHSAKTSNSYAPSFTDAGGAVKVEAGAQITTATPASVKQGGGYVLMLGQDVSNAGIITTPRGQVQLAAGDFFIVRPGQGTAANQGATTRGNEVAPQFNADSTAGRVVNSGLLQAPEGDVTLAGRKVVQDGVALATTTVDTRGTIHLLNSASDKLGSVTVTPKALNAVLIDDRNGRTALDSQRDALMMGAPRELASVTGVFDNLSLLDDRRDLSRIEIVSGGNVLFEGGSITLATGGQLAVSAGKATGRTTVADGARLDVSGAVGVQVAMASNNIEINIQGNEQRDSPLNRDNALLNNRNVWIDRRKLQRLAAGTGGYDKDRWYTPGGLLEVGGYLGLQGHSIGEWAGQGGSVTFTGGEVVTHAGSNINLSGGTLDVQTGMIRQSWLKGPDGRLYEVSKARDDIAYTGLYRGFEDEHKRWGEKTTGFFYNPLIGPQQRLENGYTVGRDAGRLVVATDAAVLEGGITSSAYQGPGQVSRPDAGLDGYAQSHDAAARAAQLILGSYVTSYNADASLGPVGAFRLLAPTFKRVVFGTTQPDIGAGLSPDTPLPPERKDALYIDSERLNGFGLGELTALASNSVKVESALSVVPGGRIRLHATQVAVDADLTARGGNIVLGNLLGSMTNTGFKEGPLPAAADTPIEVVVAKDVKLDARGLWSNLQLDRGNARGLPYIDGGSVDIRSSGAVMLSAGALIDVSSGGAVLPGGKTRGGRGGDVTLFADMQPVDKNSHALLTVDGEIRGYGVNGGGTLRLASGTGIIVGGKNVGGGLLEAGHAALTDAILLQDYQVRAGDILPVDYSYQRTRALPGEAVSSAPFFDVNANAVTLAAPWKLPDAVGTNTGLYSVSAIVNGRSQTFRAYTTNDADGKKSDTVPAGAKVTRISINGDNFPKGYIVPASVFPTGFAIIAETSTVGAGRVAFADFTIKSGTRIGAGAVFTRPVATSANVALDPGVFQSGFARYDVNGHMGVVVADNVALDVKMPVYRFTDTSRNFATGEQPANALELWTPPVWTEDPMKSVLTQRGGASLVLQSSVGTGIGFMISGVVDVRPGVAITVDPGQSISLQGRDVSVDGRLVAPGGTIAIGGGNADVAGSGLIWIGDHAVLDAASRAATARDVSGRTYGRVADGGTIRIGGALDWEATGQAGAANAFIVLRPGALLDASGSSAVLDIGTGVGTGVAVAGNGGSIVLASTQGLYLDGTMRAASGGAGAAGGTLGLALESTNYPIDRPIRGDVLHHRELVLAQTQGASAVAAAQTLPDARLLLATGTARIGVDRIEAGGFDNLSMLVFGPLSFDGNVALRMDQSLRLYAGTYALGESAAAGSAVSLSAPYVRLAGVTHPQLDRNTLPAALWRSGAGATPSLQEETGTLSVRADLIDVRDSVGSGTNVEIDQRSGRYTVDRRGFAMMDLNSSGDIRLLGGLGPLGSDRTTELSTPGSMTLTAAQIYPATGANVQILAGFPLPGFDPETGLPRNYASGSVLAIRRQGDADPAMPYSAFGSLILGAETIEQGGVVRAPLGRIMLGSHEDNSTASLVNLLAGSLTSVSGAGLVMPYGGTTDGLSYRYNGKPVTPDSVGGMVASGGATVGRGIGLKGSHVDVQNGAVLDLSGGGTLAGAGFVAGRGGSVDILATPLANANPANSYSSAKNTVYAIVPGYAGSYAPVAPEAGFGTPGIGQQVTVPAGVPGLAAGIYTLMPSNYALLPGAFRVEIGATDPLGIPGVSNVGGGSWRMAGQLSVTNSAVRESLPNQLIVTPGSQVRRHSSYNETDYNAFVLGDAARHSFLRGMITSDAKTLDISLVKPADADTERTSLKFDGETRLGAEPGTPGYSGTVNVRLLGEVLAPGQAATDGLVGASVHADELNKLHAPRLVLNGAITTSYGKNGYLAEVVADILRLDLVLRSGASLSAGDVFLTGGSDSNGDRRIVIEEGASISTIGKASGGFDSRAGYLFTGAGVVALSNGWLNLQLAPPVDGLTTTVAIDIGSCVSTVCGGTTRLVSEGTLAIATGGALTLTPKVSYGTRNLSLALAAINLGEDAGIANADANGQLPRGLVLNQAKLDQLLAGNTAIGAPALETLTLNARDAVNVFGSVKLDASGLQRLVLGTPAIYGYGAAGDVAAIRAGEFVWTGSAAAPGAAMAALLGDGTLDIAARSIVLGPGPYAQPDGVTTDARVALGFGNVKLTASERVSSSGSNTLAVYRRQGDYTPGEGYAYEGGNLRIAAPVLTGQAASKTRITAGGAITVAAASGAGASSDALGATLELKGQSIAVDGNIALPSGRLVLSATDDIVLGAASRIDLSGRKVSLFDVDKYSWGGDFVLSSAAGNITQAGGSLIDVSARFNRGGTIDATALGVGAGHVDLAGAIRGASSGTYDAGGTFVPYDAAELTVRAQTLGDFAGLNSRLNEGAVFGARRFQIKQGDLVVGDGVKAREVSIALDGGSLRVDGRIDASGYQVGSIRLAAKGDLMVNGTLDAHGTGLRVDSYGKIIDSPNRAVVDLTSSDGTLTLGAGARIDLRAGTDVAVGTGAGQNDGRARGTLDLNAPRVGTNDVAVTVNGAPVVQGAKSVAVNAFRRYDDMPLAPQADVSGYTPQLINQFELDRIDRDSQAFINAALGNTALSNRLAGLGRYHLRPGVEIVSNSVTNPHGDLTVDGDLDFSGYRYGPDANRGDPARLGFGEPGRLAIRAAGSLNINGSINDGFAPPAATPGDSSWVLTSGSSRFGGDIVVPIDGVKLEIGTIFRAGVVLNYPVTVVTDADVPLPAGTRLPVDAVLTREMSLPAGTVVGANIYNADGTVAYAAGTVLPASVVLGVDMRLGAGMALRSDAYVAALTWPKGVPLPVAMTTTEQVELKRGSLIPSMTTVQLQDGLPVNLRPVVDGAQGRNWAVAPMLGAGATSWDLKLVAGADLGAADRRALNPASAGAIRLADTHYVVDPSLDGVGSGNLSPDAFSVLRTGTGDLSLIAAGDIRMDSLYGIYTAGTATPVDATYNRARGTGADGTVIGAQSDLPEYAGSLAAYSAWYPDQGGNVLVAAGGRLVGDLGGSQTVNARGTTSAVAGNWLWRQGSGTATVGAAIPTAWWINFGAYTANDASAPGLTGFTGIGALGGGNVAVRAGDDAGTIGLRGESASSTIMSDRSEALVVAVGSTGRVGADGSLALTGGGDIDMRIAGALNPNRKLAPLGSIEKLSLTGAVANLRGATQVRAASIGSLGRMYGVDTIDTRGVDPFAATRADAKGGINLIPGDTAIYLQTLGDLALGTAADPGRSDTPNSSAFSVNAEDFSGGGQGWFSLWTGRSAINLVSAGGALTPSMATTRDRSQLSTTPRDVWTVYPSIFRAAALTGSLYYGQAAMLSTPPPEAGNFGLVLAPSPKGELEMLAGGSIYAGQSSVSMSGAGTPLPTPFNPAFVGSDGQGAVLVTNASSDGAAVSDKKFNGPSLFAFGPNSAQVRLDRAADAPPIRFYAAGGDIVGLKTGETVDRNNGAQTWYNGAGPTWIKAGRDIVNTGDAPGATTPGTGDFGGPTSVRGNLIVHANPTDVSIVSAGRDILYANFDVAGPGTLEVSAGRNLLQEDRGGIASIGPVASGDKRPGASVALMAGVGASGLDMSAIRARYLDPSKLAASGTPLAEQPGKAAKTYEVELAAWLKARYGFSGNTAQALSYFDGLAPEQQRIFLRQVYYAELREGGREYNNTASSRSGSYLRGREMIATLFPDNDAAGTPIARSGDITMFGGSGVRTNFGGDIEMMAPGGQIIVGVQGAVPPATSGVMTQGQGDIRLFSDGSLLLGLSRIMTTFGGGILAWSVKGDINAGRGSKTTVLFTPPKVVYDNLGNVEISPQVPSSGAGIATLAPIAEVPPGDVDLIAPLGTIDAGEAGIRVSGNVNVAALQVVNAANIQVKGESSGLPVIASVNVGALTNASAAASQASMAAQDAMQRDRAAARQALPSVFTVRVLGFGNEPAAGNSNSDAPADKASSTPVSYNPRSVIRVLGGGGSLPPSASRQLTDEERANLQR